MKLFSAVLWIILLTWGSGVAQAKIIRTVEKTFTVQAGGQLRATTYGGEIVVKSDNIAQVRIVAIQSINASTEDAADKLLKKLKLNFGQTDHDVAVTASYEQQPPGIVSGSWPPVQVSYAITVPRSFNLQLKTSGGDVKVASIKGTVSANSSGGNLWFDRIDGELDATTSGGDITLAEGTARVTLTTSGGNIQIDRAGGPTSVTTSGGDIGIKAVKQLIQATSSGGNIHVTLTDMPRQNGLLSTSGGDVTLQVPRDASWTLDAQTIGGEVTASGVAISVSKTNADKSRLVGAVHSGGQTLTLRTSGGDIAVRAK